MSRTLAGATAVADRRVTGLFWEGAGRAGRRAGAALAGAPAQPCWPTGHASRRSKPEPGTGRFSSTGLPPTLVRLRHGVTQDGLACWFGVSCSTITRAVGEIRPLPG